MNGGYCCPNCFDDPGLTEHIIPDLKTRFDADVPQGACSYCHEQSSLLVSPSSLAEVFEPLFDIYEVSDSSEAESIVKILRSDWCLFRSLDEDVTVHSLLSEIIDDGNRFRNVRFARSARMINQEPLSWPDLRDQMMHQNRWFTNPKLDRENFQSVLESLSINSESISSAWYRCRSHRSNQASAFMPNEMGAPPKEQATHGRANPAGIPVLYLASDLETAVSEVRPHVGEVVSVATFNIAGKSVVDLRYPRWTASPFTLGDSELISQMHSDLPLMTVLGEQLTRPVSIDRSAYEYAPSQFLCELIKACNYDGVVYKSGVADGSNMVLFDSNVATASSVEVRRVESVTIRSSSLDEGE
ncbi:RES family NAD+ phosphorylase [Micrococcus endophyticus]|nr:RES family NAD+ phosphorylase [Micrococcus endophyticus]